MKRLYDPYSLQLFAIVAREGSIARAAEAAHIAPSALSRRLAALEHELGLPLMARSARGVEVLPAGQLLLEQSRRLDQQMRGVIDAARAMHGQEGGQLRLAVTLPAMLGELPKRLAPFLAMRQDIELTISQHRSRELARLLQLGEADVAVGYVDDPPAGMDVWAFGDDPLVALLPAGHPLSSSGTLRLKQLLAHPIVRVFPGDGFDTMLQSEAARLGLAVRSNLGLVGTEGIATVVAAGLGLAVVPIGLARAGGGAVVWRPIDEPWAHRVLRVFTLRTEPQRPGVVALVESLREPSGQSRTASTTLKPLDAEHAAAPVAGEPVLAPSTKRGGVRVIEGGRAIRH